MKRNRMPNLLTPFALFIFIVFSSPVMSQEKSSAQNSDEKVRSFLEGSGRSWRDMNVPSSDGKLLYDIIIKNNYKRALEIGTSTGHSGTWIAWALSKTGGKLITIEIDPSRHKQALANFEKAGLSRYVDARLGDAHELVKELQGPFDFVFSDADKEWYTNYFLAVDPKLAVGGCFTAHNISGRGQYGTGEFLNHVLGLKNYETTVDRSGGGLSISYKKSK
ncbi:MAG: O-methyltransferase [Candidatus Latescibacterota bacterium]